MTTSTSINIRTAQKKFQRRVIALLIAGIAIAGWQLWPSGQGRIGLVPSLVSHDEASDFTGMEINSSSTLSDYYSYADYVGPNGDTHLIIELVYDDYELPAALPAPSDGRTATVLVDGGGNAVPVPGDASGGAILDFATRCVRIRVSGTGFSVNDEKLAQFRNLLIERAASAAQGKPPSC